ncbi:MAG: GrpB family protein [Parcubacteria group bacterium]|nr:GrpB family protein [Parcubacteria group bacterium]
MGDISHTVLLDHQLSWKEKFETEKVKLLDIFSDKAIAVEHIGSTSVESLSSKPIIDIAVMVDNHKDADSFTRLLAKINYRFDSLSTERHFYTKGDPIEYHLSIAYKNKGGFWERQILFRDYLRSHPDFRDEYQQLKENLLQNDPTGQDVYLSGKTEFVNKVLALARIDVNQNPLG